jgi:peptidyl-prolyl cis-trans isomerase C
MQLLKGASAAGIALAGMLILTACKAEQGVVATVNGVPIPQARMEYVIRSQVQQGQQDNEQLRQQVKDVLITREVLAQEAIRKGLDQSQEVQTGVEMAKQEFLIRAYFDDFIKNNAVTEEEMKAEYEQVKSQQTADGARKEYRARHILIKVDQKDAQDSKKWAAAQGRAKSILAEVNKSKGKNFAQLAKTRSQDPSSKADGGLLDWSDGSNFVKEFSDAMVQLNRGEWTKQPVKTSYGYHIIMLDDVRSMEFPPYEIVKERIAQRLMTVKRDKAIEALRAAAKIE